MTAKKINPYSGMSTADRWKAYFEGKINLDDSGFFFDSDPCLTENSSILIWEPSLLLKKFFPLFFESHFEGKIEVTKTAAETVRELEKHDFNALLIRFEPSPNSLLEKCRLAGFSKPIFAYTGLEGKLAMEEVLRHRLNGYIRKLHHDFNSLARLLKIGSNPIHRKKANF